MNKIKPYTWIVRFDVAPEWVADGFNLTDERALLLLAGDLRHADSSFELAARVLAAPAPLRIAREQGYGPKHNGAGGAVAEIMSGAPHAYSDVRKCSDVTVDNAISAAIDLLNSVAFVRDENDNTGAILAKLRDARALLRGDDPISEIQWRPVQD